MTNPLQDFTWRKPLHIKHQTTKCFKLKLVSIHNLKSEIKSPKSKKSAGLDKIPASGLVPTDWKAMKIVPVFKIGSRNQIENHRSISVVPAISKVIEKVVYKQFLEYLDTNQLLRKTQFGFRPKQ